MIHDGQDRSLVGAPGAPPPGSTEAAPSLTLSGLRAAFRHPGDDARVLMRWWWFGSSTPVEDLDAQLQTMADAGLGGVEVAMVYPLDVSPDPGPFPSPRLLERLRHAASTAARLGLRFDVTLTSGWPFGGPHIGPDLAARQLRWDYREVPPSVERVPLPSLWDGDRLVGAYCGSGSLEETPDDWTMLTELDGALVLPHGRGSRLVLFVLSSRTGQIVKRAADGAEGYVLDHFSRAATRAHIAAVCEPLLDALPEGSVSSVFCDSLEVMGSDWTDSLPVEFAARRGYELLPVLPLLGAAGDAGDVVRRDVGRTLSELFEEGFLAPLHAWAQDRGVPLRVQAYGKPVVPLGSYRHCDLPEGEGWGWRTLTATKWASSAAHLLGRPVVSSETWTWVHSPSFRATPLDLKGEAHEHFLAGINQLVGHGWPSSSRSAGDPGWMFYAAGALSEKNSWWPVMPALARYLQRLSSVLRQGEPVRDVAILAPTETAYARRRSHRDHLDLFRGVRDSLGPDLVPVVLDAGYDWDLVDESLLDEIHAPRVILVPPGTPTGRGTLDALARAAARGCRILAVGSAAAPGWPYPLASARTLAADLATTVPPSVTCEPASAAVGVVRRRTADADIVLVVNTGAQGWEGTVYVRTDRSVVERWDASSGDMVEVATGGGPVPVSLEPYAAALLVVHDGDAPGVRTATPSVDAARRVLHTGWRDDADQPVVFPAVGTDPAGRRSVTVHTDLVVDAAELRPGRRLWLDLGAGTPVLPGLATQGTGEASYRVGYVPPVADAATVRVAGTVAGHLYEPPFRAELTDLLRPGTNRVEIEVYPSATHRVRTHEWAALEERLTAHYGRRFRLQDVGPELLAPEFGIRSAPQLVTTVVAT